MASQTTEAERLLAETARLGLSVSVEAGRLVLRGPRGAASETLRAALTEHKAAIVRHLSGPEHDALSFSQQRLWLLDRLQPGSSAYHLPFALTLDGRLDVPALERALGEVQRRHAILRTTFPETDGRPAPSVAAPEPHGLRLVQVPAASEAEREAEARKLALEEARRSFDLGAGPLFRTLLLRLAAERHILVVTLHHVVADGQSVGVLAREIGVLYAAEVEGRPSPLPELTLQYSDFARFEREALRGPEATAQLAYWRRQLAGLVPLTLPHDRPQPAVPSFQGGFEQVVLDRRLADGIRALARAESATTFMVLLAAFKVLLRRWAGEEDVAVGTPIANRARPEAEALVGPFVNTLVLRSNLAGAPSFRELVARVRRVALDAYANQDVPFERLLDELQPERAARRSSVFQVFFNMMRLPSEPMALSGLALGLLDLEADFAKFDLSVYAFDAAGELGLVFNYSRDRFEARTARRMLDQYRAVLERAVARPELPIADLLERPAGRSSQGSATRAATLPASFAAVVERCRERPALASERELTYGRLAAASAATAHAILERVGRPGQVALLFDHGAPMVAGMLGVLQAGGAYVPLDPRYPRERLAFVLDDAEAGCVLTDQANAGLARELAGPRRRIVVAEEALARGGEAAGVPARPDAVAYILYTSGSTGRPKGVVQSHANVARHAAHYARVLSLQPEDRLSLLASYAHDAAVVDVFGALLHGACLLPYDVATAGLDGLHGWAETRRPTIVHCTPTVFRAWLRGREAFRPASSVRAVVLGGEAARPADLALFRSQFPAVARLVNGLGATESTFHLMHVVAPSDAIDERVVPVGRPLDGVDVVLLDERGEPTDLRGEIAVRGDAIALGYWRRPDLTAQAFVPDPAGGGGRLYRTGDVARLLPDGSYAFEGRRDLQVKVRGVRVELGEVEAALAAHPSVRAAAAAVWEPVPGEPALAGYYVPREAGPIGVDLARHLRDALPPAMVPTALVRLAELPLTTTRKLDRRALPPPDGSEIGERPGYAPPRSPLEEGLASIFRDLLGVERAGVHDSFFDLGGHSLRASQLVSRIRDVFGVELPLRRVFDEPTLGALAFVIAAAREGGANPREAAIPRLSRHESEDSRFPASFAQERLWFLDRLDPVGPGYVLSGGVLLSGPLDEPCLRGALERLVARHEALRTRFDASDGPLVQVVSPDVRLPFETIDLRGEGRPEARLQAIAREEALRPFSLEEGPLLRVTLVRTADEEHALLVSLHHIVGDGWSVGVFVRELATHYAALRDGRPSRLPELTVQYGDFAVWQRAEISGERLEAHVAWWRERLVPEPPVATLPSDDCTPGVAPWQGGAHAVSIPEETVARLRQVCRTRGVTPFMALLAAFAAVLARHADQDDLVIGCPVANRDRGEVEGLIGFFVNTLPLRVDLAGDPSFDELLGRVREMALGAYAHQDLPFERLVSALATRRAAGRHPLFDIVFALQNTPREVPELPGLRLRPLPREVEATRFTLECTLWESEQAIHALFVYAKDRLSPDRVARLAGQYLTLLASALAEPDQRLSALPLLGGDERPRLAAASRDWNATERPYPRERSVHGLFAEVARRRAGAEAVADAEGSLSYGDLERRANRVARALREHGVGSESRVGLFVERSVEMVVGMLAILKAGGAYVPLDPSYPAARLGFMVEDAGVRVVLTRRALRDKLPAGGTAVVLEELEGGDEEGPDLAVFPDQLAYVIYTSGSTGRPKGVAVTHRSIVRLVRDTDYVSLGETDVVAQASNASFDAATFEVWGALINGARLAVIQRETVLSPSALASEIARRGVTVLFQTTALFNQVAREAPQALSPLRTLLFGGEAVDPRWVKEALTRGRPGRILHVYGPTENTTFSTWQLVGELREGAATVPIGRPIANSTAHVLDARLELLPVGVVGELYVGGDGLARGYVGRPELTAERFVPSPFGAGERLYRTGDRVRRRADGSIEFVGRLDDQVKLRGFRVELGEIEKALLADPAVRECAVLVREDEPGEKRIVAYLVPLAGEPASSARAAGPLVAGVRERLRSSLPDYMVPQGWVVLERLPVNANGKVDRRALPVPEPLEAEETCLPRGVVEEAVAAAWREVLGRDDVSAEENFFDAGGHSLLLARLHRRLEGRLPRAVSLVELFEFATIRGLARHVAGESDEAAAPGARTAERRHPAVSGTEIAVVAIAGRFPGAPDVETFWSNLCEGKESITFFSREELLAAGVDPALVARPDYVPARGVLEGADLFDPTFFGYSQRDASLIDPQQRLFLECAHEALERAGIDPGRGGGRVGVFAGVAASSYHARIAGDPQAVASLDGLSTVLAAEKDFVATRASYKLDLRGPSLTVQTACSTSLVAVHLACRSLLGGECDTALAGGARVYVPQASGYVFQEGSILSSDGHCRPFDASATGCVPGSGVGVVVLRRLADALADGDPVLAVVKGSAVNNDGSAKAGYTAPGIEGQAEVIAAAQAAAGTPSESIGFVEAHGTGTRLGDPIEVRALTRAFRRGTEARGFCALGAAKANVGHLDAAAGVAGLIKAVLALRHARIPPAPHFRQPNPEIDFAASPFFVNTTPVAWDRKDTPRRAAVSSFGLGGTNAHVVLEEALALPAAGTPGREWQLLPISARTSGACEASAARLAVHLRESGETDLAAVAFTLQAGRRRFRHRRAIVARTAAEAAQALDRLAGVAAEATDEPPTVAFLLPGQGAQRVDMGRGLYESEPRFREEVNRCSHLLAGDLGCDIRSVLYPGDAAREDAERALVRTELAQPALFVVEYALARLFMSWGIAPAALLGHSLGEYVAACLAGVFPLEAALALVAERGRLMQQQPAGAMTAVPRSEAGLARWLGDGVDLAAVNAPELCVVAGPEERIERLEQELLEEGTECRRLRTSHAFHSRMMDPVCERLRARVATVRLAPPRIPFLSSLTGTWITAAQATDPGYWAEQMRRPVRFAEGLRELLREPRALVEGGPRGGLAGMARAQGAVAFPSLGAPGDAVDAAVAQEALARLWVAGIEPDWAALHAPARPRKVALPTYPFERRPCWIEPARRSAVERRVPAGDRGIASWFHVPTWTRASAPPSAGPLGPAWLVFTDESGLGDAIARQLDAASVPVASVAAGNEWQELGPRSFRLRAGCAEDYTRLLSLLAERGIEPLRIAHAWGVDSSPGFAAAQDRGFHSLRLLAAALGSAPGSPPREVLVVTSGVHDVTGEEDLRPERATVLGACRVLPQEHAGLSIRSVDLLPADVAAAPERAAGRILAELGARAEERVIAHRRGHRFVQAFAPLVLDGDTADARRLRTGGVYLIVGGLGAVGLRCAALLSESVGARLVLVGRAGLPPREDWPRLLAGGGSDPRLGQIEAVRRLENAGTEVLVLAADVGDEAAMRAAFARARERFSGLDGVLHVAGTEKRAQPLVGLDAEAYERELHPKVRGLEVLRSLLEDQPVGFCFVASSLSAVLGAVGAGAYAAAHAYVDAFVAARRLAAGTEWVSANLDNWSREEDAPAAASSEAGFGMSAAEGALALRRVLGQREARQVVVSAGDLQWRLDRWVHRPAPPAPTAARAGRDGLGIDYAPARTEAEKTLVAIWQDLLGTEPVGIHDNFFELGGDSVIGIQVAARAGGAGLRLSARSVMENPTIAELALRAVPAEAQPRPSSSSVVSACPLTPIQRWFFDLGLSVPQHFNQAVLLEVDPLVRPERVAAGWRELVARHDALRLRFAEGARTGATVSADPEAAPFAHVDLSRADRPAEAIAAEVDRAHASLDLARGPIARALFLDLGAGRPARLLLLAHHLAVDVTSWRVLLEELTLACQADGEAVLPSAGVSFAESAVRLTGAARDPRLEREGEYWLSRAWDKVRPLPRERSGPNLAGSTRTLATTIGSDETSDLVLGLPRRYAASVQDALLAAVALALRDWTGARAALVDVEGHGRDGLVDGLDLSRTVGWFTSLFPLLVELDEPGEERAVLAVKEQVRAVPRGGVGYGALVQLAGERPQAERLLALPRPEVSFLYAGRLDGAVPQGLFRPAAEPRGSLRHPADLRPHLLEVQAHVAGNGLHVALSYSEQVHDERPVEACLARVAEALRAIAACARQPGRVLTPSDVPAARLRARELERLSARLGRSVEPGL